MSEPGPVPPSAAHSEAMTAFEQCATAKDLQALLERRGYSPSIAYDLATWCWCEREWRRAAARRDDLQDDSPNKQFYIGRAGSFLEVLYRLRGRPA